jgi:hypothetical protein
LATPFFGLDAEPAPARWVAGRHHRQAHRYSAAGRGAHMSKHKNESLVATAGSRCVKLGACVRVQGDARSLLFLLAV